jgi:putative transposase
METSSNHYRSRCPDQAGLEARIKAVCETRVRYGYRRVHVLLQREGWRINIDKTHRIYKALGRQLRDKTPKRSVKAKLREDRRKATRPNETRAMELAVSRRPSGRPRPAGDGPKDQDPDRRGHLQPLLAGDRSTVPYRSENFVKALDRACGRLGYPKASPVVQGAESVSRNLDLWA